MLLCYQTGQTFKYAKVAPNVETNETSLYYVHYNSVDIYLMGYQSYFDVLKIFRFMLIVVAVVLIKINFIC